MRAFPCSGKDNRVFHRGSYQGGCWQQVSALVLAGWAHCPGVEGSSSSPMPSLCGGLWCRCSRQVLPCLCSALLPPWPCRSESSSSQFSVRGSCDSDSQRCCGSGCCPGSCPELGGGVCSRGRWTRGTMPSTQEWAFQPPHGSLPVCSPPFLPDNTPRLQAVIFHSLLPPPHQPHSSRSRNEEPGAQPFPKHISRPNACRGCSRGAAAPHCSLSQAAKGPFSPSA